MPEHAEQPARQARLPIDDGRGPDEPWPWAILEDYTSPVQWERPLVLLGFTTLLGSVLAYWASAGWMAYVGVILIACVLGLLNVRSQLRDPWPGWRLRNLRAADNRANCSLAEVDPAFAREMGYGSVDPDKHLDSGGKGHIEDGAARSVRPEKGTDRERPSRPRIPPMTTGPTVPWHGADGFPEDDDLPF